jgi:membrane-associated phospholipid phosphatase
MIFWQLGFPVLYYLLITTILWLNSRSARQPRHLSARLPFDDRIPFRPGLSPVYFSAYGLGVVGYLAVVENPVLPRVVIGYFVLFMVCALFYWFLPSRIERGDPETSPLLRARWLAAYQRTAAPYNNFPSMHTAFCAYSALIVLRFFQPAWLGWLMLFWVGLVMASTLFTKQHYFLDLLAGVLVSAGIFWIILA